MGGKGLIWMGMFVGSFVGGVVPVLWGGGVMSYLLWSTIGGVLGVWAGFKFAKNTGAI